MSAALSPEASMSAALAAVTAGILVRRWASRKVFARRMLEDPSWLEFQVGRGVSKLGPHDGIRFVDAAQDAQERVVSCALFAKAAVIQNLEAARLAFRYRRRFERVAMREAA